MISSFFGRKFGARLAGNMVPELGWTSFELAGITRPLCNTFACGLNRYYFPVTSKRDLANLLTDIVGTGLEMDD